MRCMSEGVGNGKVKGTAGLEGCCCCRGCCCMRKLRLSEAGEEALRAASRAAEADAAAAAAAEEAGGCAYGTCWALGALVTGLCMKAWALESDIGLP